MTGHYPVMLPEILESIQPKDGGVYVDGTFGAGGYATALLDAANCTVIAIDRDPDAQKRAAPLAEKYGDRLVFICGCFGNVEALLDEAHYGAVDGFVLDLGVSSFQIDEAGRGFSFRFNGPLDMRMGTGGETAADIVNTYEEEALANIIYRYGEERKSRHIAKAIVTRRAEAPFKTTEDLADLIRDVIPKTYKDKIDPATRTFQALRIAVNDELGELERALAAAENILNPDGRLVVVAFHSLEDRMVKEFLREKSGSEPRASKYMPEQAPSAPPVFALPSKKALKPSEQELSENGRSRSARLRWAIRTGGAS